MAAPTRESGPELARVRANVCGAICRLARWNEEAVQGAVQCCRWLAPHKARARGAGDVYIGPVAG